MAGSTSPLDMCQKATASRAEVRDCLDRRLRAAEAAMERVAMTVHANMAEIDRGSGEAGAVAKFEDSERAFRDYLDRHCAWIGAAGAGGSAEVVNDCLIRLTEQHTTELQAQRPARAKTASPAQPQKQARAGVILQGEWKLTYAMHQGRRLTLPEQPRVTLSFDPSGMAAGRSFVNRYFGTASMGDRGQFGWSGALGSTRMAGPPELMSAEEQYFKALESVSRWRIENGALVLDTEDGGILMRYSR